MPEPDTATPAPGAWLQFDLQHQEGSLALNARAALHKPLAVLVGPSGSGKTSLLRAIAGLLRPQLGHIQITGATVFASETRLSLAPAARSCGLLMQRAALFPTMTAETNIAFGMHRLSVSEQKQRIAEMAALFRLESLLARRPSRLSGGEQQRVALARTLAPHPRVLLLDEPFPSLNLTLKDAILEDLQTWLAKTGTPALYVTHDVAEAWRLGSRPDAEVLRMEEGRIVAQGAAVDVLGQERHQLLDSLS